MEAVKQLAKFFTLCEVLGFCEKKNEDEISMMIDVYYGLVGDLPAAIFKLCLEKTLKSWKYSKTMPTPAYMMDIVKDEVADLNMKLKRIDLGIMQVKQRDKYVQRDYRPVKQDMTKVFGVKGVGHDESY